MVLLLEFFIKNLSQVANLTFVKPWSWGRYWAVFWLWLPGHCCCHTWPGGKTYPIPKGEWYYIHQWASQPAIRTAWLNQTPQPLVWSYTNLKHRLITGQISARSIVKTVIAIANDLNLLTKKVAYLAVLNNCLQAGILTLLWLCFLVNN